MIRKTFFFLNLHLPPYLDQLAWPPTCSACTERSSYFASMLGCRSFAVINFAWPVYSKYQAEHDWQRCLAHFHPMDLAMDYGSLYLVEDFLTTEKKTENVQTLSNFWLTSTNSPAFPLSNKPVKGFLENSEAAFNIGS
jgi:hypothetical protein